MIITRTPFRVSFAGGGTDIDTFYRDGFGAVLSATINKYMYIMVNKRFDDSIRVSYSKTEIVNDLDELKHDIVRECLRMVGISKGIEITSIADIPSGTGLGSSSSFTVGLLNALYSYLGQQRSAHELAEKACKIEIEILQNPIGKQDQFAAAYGGINYYQFNKNETVEYIPIVLDEKEKIKLNMNLLMFYTGISRNANEILEKQGKRAFLNRVVLEEMREQATCLKEMILKEGITDKIGEVLHQGWESKKTLSKSISSKKIDDLYEKAREAGAIGGKLLGAGGGGFLLLYCKANSQADVRKVVDLPEIGFQFTHHGSRVVYLGGD